jgi:heptosyltransferase-1
MRVLLIKMSSLGDVVHALAPVTDAAKAVQGITFDWVVEEAYQEIPKWHPSVSNLIIAPLRRWRKSPVRTIRSGELGQFREQLRAKQYDLVLDAQGLLKSAFVGRRTGLPVTGRSRKCIREPAASMFYARKIDVDLRLSEVEQLRQLFARAIGYEPPRSPADFGIEPERFTGATTDRYALFLHGAAWDTKLWPEDRWIALGHAIAATGLKVLLPWGSEAEQLRAERIAAAVGGEVMDKAPIGSLAQTVAGAEFVVGLDTGLTHIAVAFGVPTLTIYGPSVPVYDQVARGELINVTSGDSHIVDTKRPTTVAASKVIAAVRPWLKRIP